MIKKLEKLYHRYDEQKKVYAKYGSKLSIEEKYSLIYEYLNNKRDFWGYFQLLCDITLEISDDSDKFISLLSEFDKKVRNDMAQKPFMDLLIQLGSKEFALTLYEKIIKDSKLEDNLRVISGLILGGYTLNNSNQELNKKVKEKIQYPITNSCLKAILVVYDNKKIDTTTTQYFNKILKDNNSKILPELAFVSLRFYNKSPDYFYKSIKYMIGLNNINLNWTVFNRLTYNNMLNKEQFFELIDEAKDYDIKIIDEIVETFRQYPNEHKRIVDLLIYWINKFDKFEFDSHNFRWILEELVKKNKYFIKEFFDRYKEIKPDKKLYLFTFPHIFEILSKYHQDYALNKIFKLKIKYKDDEHISLELCRKFIGNIYTDQNKKDLVIKLNDKLIELTENRSFISFNKKKYYKKLSKFKLNKEISKDSYDYLINISNDLLNKLRSRKQQYDFDTIRKNISKYPNVKRISKDLINSLEKSRKFSPLLWLGETEEPKLDDIKISKEENELSKAMKLSYARNQFWSRAYLKELNSAIQKYISLPNEKYLDINKRILTNLSDEKSFWAFESELVFINRFSKKEIEVLEPKVPNRPEKNLDLKLNLFNKNIFFEIKRPQIDRNLNLNNAAVSMPNKALQSIEHKFKQMMAKKTIDEMKTSKRSDLFFIVIDTSISTIDEYEIMNAFFGSLSLTLVMDKKTGKTVNQYPSRKDDSISKINPNTDIISGVIYFKQELMFDEKNQPFIKLNGNIIQNPEGINLLNENEIKKLKEVIFK